MEIRSEIRREALTGALSKRAAIAKYKVCWHTLKKILAHDEPPGEAQVDFGEATVRIAGKDMKVALGMTLPHSGAMFVQAFPKECTETFMEGHRRAFEEFGGVPRRISFDNSAIAVIEVLNGRERKLTRKFLRLQSRYLFTEHFCLVRRANEKGHVERFSLEEVTAGVEYAIDIGLSDSDSIRSVVEHRADGPVQLFPLDGSPHLACVHVETTPVAAYQVLLEEVAS